MYKDPEESRNTNVTVREYLSDSLESIRVFRWAWREFVPSESRRWAVPALISLLLASVFSMLEPLAIKWAIEALIARDWTALVRSLGTVGGLFLLAHWFFTAFMHFREYCLGYNITRLDTRLTEMFMEKSLGQHMCDSDDLSAANMEKGRARLLQMQEMMLLEGGVRIAELLISFAILWIVFPVAGAVMTSALFLHMFSSLFLNRSILKVCTPLDAEFRRINRFRVERWDNIERVKTCGKEHEETNRLHEDYDNLIVKDRRFWHWFIQMISIRGSVINLISLGMLCLVSWGIWSGEWTVAAMLPMYIWVRRICDNMWRVSKLEEHMNHCMPSVMSLRRAMNVEPDIVDSDQPVLLSSEESVNVVLDGVTYAYRDRGHEVIKVLDNISFDIEPGEKVALLGDSGAGKTTLMRLVQRFCDPTSGSILVGGYDLREVSVSSWISRIGYIAQQAQVLDGTIRYNLLYGLPEDERDKVTDEDLWRVMRLLKIDFGERLTDGLNTVVGRRGIKLSGGQAQRLMVGAAVLKHPKFMVIDEATSSLDSTTERAVQDGLQKLLGPEVSALIVTHRLSTVRELCSKFVVLRSFENTPPGEQQVEAVADSFEKLHQVSPTFRRLATDQGIQL